MSARTPEHERGGALLLTDHQLERLADLIAERLRGSVPLPELVGEGETPGPRQETPGLAGLVGAGALGDLLGVSRTWIYGHSDELGAVRLGQGPRARLRFDPEVSRQALSRYGSDRSDPLEVSNGGAPERPQAPRRRSLATRRPLSAATLPSRPRRAAA